MSEGECEPGNHTPSVSNATGHMDIDYVLRKYLKLSSVNYRIIPEKKKLRIKNLTSHFSGSTHNYPGSVLCGELAFLWHFLILGLYYQF